MMRAIVEFARRIKSLMAGTVASLRSWIEAFRTRDAVERLNIVSKLALTGASVLIAGVGLRLERADRLQTAVELRRSLSQQLSSQNARSAAESRAYRAQLAASAIPLAISGGPDEQRRALTVLQYAAPGAAMVVSAGLVDTASSDSMTRLVTAVNAASARLELEEQFQEHLKFARSFVRYELYEEACQEYLLAWNRLPGAYVEEYGRQVDFSAFQIAVEDCGRGKYRESVETMQRVLTALQSH
jgi:hypothetical protein